jgi:hypothetical protein
MPKTIKTLLFLFALDLIVFCAAGVGFLRHHETQAAEQTLSVRQQEARRFLAQDTAVDEVAPRSASYEACVRFGMITAMIPSRCIGGSRRFAINQERDRGTPGWKVRHTRPYAGACSPDRRASGKYSGTERPRSALSGTARLLKVPKINGLQASRPRKGMNAAR